MNKVRVFMVVTAFTTFILFNFYKAVDIVLGVVFDHIKDRSVYPYGPYYSSCPIQIIRAKADGLACTNKLALLLNWKWDFDMNGVNLQDLKRLEPGSAELHVKYLNKRTHEVQYCIVSFDGHYIIKKNNKLDIQFDEVPL